MNRLDSQRQRSYIKRLVVCNSWNVVAFGPAERSLYSSIQLYMSYVVVNRPLLLYGMLLQYVNYLLHFFSFYRLFCFEYKQMSFKEEPQKKFFHK